MLGLLLLFCSWCLFFIVGVDFFVVFLFRVVIDLCVLVFDCLLNLVDDFIVCYVHLR